MQMTQEATMVWEVQAESTDITGEPTVELVETETTERGQVTVQVEKVTRVTPAAVAGAYLKSALRHFGALGRGKAVHERIRAARLASTARVSTETVVMNVDVPVKTIKLRPVEDKLSALLEVMRRSLGEEQDLLGRLVCELRAGESEPGSGEEPRAVYRNVPITSVREETDYSRPIRATRSVVRRVAPGGLGGFLRGLDNLLDGNGFTDFTTDEVTEVVGYGKRRISEITGYRHEFDHTETYQVQDGVRVMSVSFRPAGRPG
jgi:hypothetical protein